MSKWETKDLTSEVPRNTLSLWCISQGSVWSFEIFILLEFFKATMLTTCHFSSITFLSFSGNFILSVNYICGSIMIWVSKVGARMFGYVHRSSDWSKYNKKGTMALGPSEFKPH